MGQKSNVIGSRLGNSRGWMSKWFSEKNGSPCIQRDILLRDFIVRAFERRGMYIGRIRVTRLPHNTIVKVVVYSQKRIPSKLKHKLMHKALLYINGSNVDLKIVDVKRAYRRKANRMRKFISKRLHTYRLRSYFKQAQHLLGGAFLFNSASLLSTYIARQVEKDVRGTRQFLSFLKRVLPLFVRMWPHMKGLKFVISGRFNPSGRSKNHTFQIGRNPYQVVRVGVDYASAKAHTRYGVCGVHVWMFYNTTSTLRK